MIFFLCAILLSFIVEFRFSFIYYCHCYRRFYSLGKKKDFIHTHIYFFSFYTSKDHQIEGHDPEDSE